METRIGSRIYTDHTYIMGILNVTPDSFSDGGRYTGLDAALFHAEQMLKEGADLLDVGGESTRPGYTRISDEEEISRIAPVIEAIRARLDIPVSADTYKPKVAAAALQAGADMINDIWGFQAEPGMAQLVAEAGAACCLMHNREKAEYNNFLDEFCEDMRGCLSIAKEAGIADDQIILDPGVGFGKNYEHNLTIIHHLERLCDMGYPVLLATSRKSCIGQALDLPTDQRVEGTMVTTVMGVLKGAAFVRVHDVKENLRAIRMTQAILRDGRNG